MDVESAAVGRSSAPGTQTHSVGHGTAAHEEHGLGLRSRSLSMSSSSTTCALALDVSKAELVKTANARTAGRNNEFMPPQWFMPRATFANQTHRAQRRHEAHDVTGQTSAWVERWLSSPVLSQLDDRAVWLPVTFVLGSMVVLQPALILGWLSPAVDGEWVRKQSPPRLDFHECF